jgi:glycosyltransferase involved in cell wall biosynthesis
LYDILPTFVPVLLKRIPYREFFEGALQFLLSKKYDAVVTVGHRPAIVFAFLNRVTGLKKKQVVKELFIDERGVQSKFASFIYRWAFKNVSLIITNSSGEIPHMMNWLRIPEDRFRFIPWPANIPGEETLSGEGEYVFAAGRSFRDWETFFKAVQSVDAKYVIVAPKEDISNSKLPSRIEVHCGIPHGEYLGLLRRAKIVVVPLKKTFRSIGQAVMLEAMAFGKPVITAKLAGTLDYIQPGVNGFFYEPGDAGALRDAILRLLEDNELQRKLGEAARQSVQNSFNKDNYSKMMVETMGEVCLHG